MDDALSEFLEARLGELEAAESADAALARTLASSAAARGDDQALWDLAMVWSDHPDFEPAWAGQPPD